MDPLIISLLADLVASSTPLIDVEPTLSIAPVLLAALISAGVKGVSAIAKGVKARKLKKDGEAQMEESIENIKYSRPEEYGDIMGLLEGRTNSVGSRQQTAEDKVKANTAGSVAGFTQIADSPVGALGGFAQLKARESQALADINLQYEGIKDEAILGEVKGLEMGAGYSDKEQYWNDMYKNQVHANMGGNKMEAGQNMGWQAFEQLGSAGLDYAGTKYLSNAYNPQSPQPGDVSPGAVTPEVTHSPYSPPSGTYDKIG